MADSSRRPEDAPQEAQGQAQTDAPASPESTPVHVLEAGDSDLPFAVTHDYACLLYTSPSPRDRQKSRMPSSA